MKRVRYLVGATGLAPIAAGLAAPGVAHAGTTHAVTPPHGKTVSLRHTGMRPGTGNHDATTFASLSSGASSGATGALGGCTGDTKVTLAKDGHVRGKLWYTNNWDDSYTCIGTVDASLYYSHSDCKWVKVSARYQGQEYNGNAWGPETKTVCGTPGEWKVVPFGIHEEFQHVPADSGMHVNIWSQYGGGTGAQFGS